MKIIIQKALFGAALSIVAGSAMAAASSDQLVSPESSLTVAGDSNFVTLHDGSKFAAHLRITGPDGLLVEREFEAGEPIVFETSGKSAPLQDGSYNFEIVWQGDAEKSLQMEPNSGSFRIAEGVVPDTSLSEGKLQKSDLGLKAQVFATDLVVQGSGCFGFDCVNGESFGFDTLRLKENNLRIKFQDTSNSGSFPSRDWEIGANDTNNGGADKFFVRDVDGGRIPFTIEANAPSNSLYVDDGGRMGLGTNTPVVQAHMVDGNTPTMRLDQNGSDGFASQVWDVAGNETNFFIRDVTNGSELPFKIRPGADDDRLVLDNDNNIGIGTGNPDTLLHVKDSGRSAIKIEAGNNQQADLTFNSGGTDRFVVRTRANTNNFEIGRRNSSGGFADTPLLITHDTGEVIIENGLKLDSSATPAVHGSGVAIFFDSNDDRLKLRLPNGDVRAVVVETP